MPQGYEMSQFIDYMKSQGLVLMEALKAQQAVENKLRPAGKNVANQTNQKVIMGNVQSAIVDPGDKHSKINNLSQCSEGGSKQ